MLLGCTRTMYITHILINTHARDVLAGARVVALSCACHDIILYFDLHYNITAD